MKISELISGLQRILDLEGDLVVVHYTFEKHWDPVDRVFVHPAGRPHGRRKNVHLEKVVEIGDEW